MSKATTGTSYDEVPYHGIAIPTTHPDHLAALATLFGMCPAAIEQCRVLELGCAEGGNLLPMAYTLPDSQFVGVDLSARQIEQAQTLATALELKNIEFHATDIRLLDDQLGQFDYIIAYGIYSWVSPDAQQAILAICRGHLAPQGVALISYNTYPGWHLRGSIREMLRYHSDRLASPQERAAKSRELLDFLTKSTATLGRRQADLALYSQLLELEQSILASKPDFYLLHEHLEAENNPLYFHQFIERATTNGLQYLADAHLSTMLPSSLPQEIASGLAELALSPIEFEQYRDFLVNRSFRQTLLCHAEIELRRDLQSTQMQHFAFAAPVRLVAAHEPNYSPTVPKLRNATGAVISLRTPLSAAALTILVELYPQALPFDQLLVRSCAQIGVTDPADRDSYAQRLGDALLSCLTTSMVEIHTHLPQIANTPSEYPVVSQLARLQIRSSTTVTNLLHNPVALDPIAAHMLQYMDGRHDWATLREQLVQLVESGVAHAEGEDSVLTPDQLLHDCLNRLIHMALLIS